MADDWLSIGFYAAIPAMVASSVPKLDNRGHNIKAWKIKLTGIVDFVSGKPNYLLHPPGVGQRARGDKVILAFIQHSIDEEILVSLETPLTAKETFDAIIQMFSAKNRTIHLDIWKEINTVKLDAPTQPMNTLTGSNSCLINLTVSTSSVPGNQLFH